MVGKDKFKLFVINMFVYGVGNILTKLVPFIMLPIIVRLMPSTSYFGISDMASVIVSFASGFATMGIYDALFRLYFDKEDVKYQKALCSTALFIVLCNSLFILIISLIFQNILAYFFFGYEKYAFVIFLCGITAFWSTQGSIGAAPTRMQNRRWIFLVANFISSLIAYSISLFMIFREYYVTAIIFGNLISGMIYALFFTFLNKRYFSLKCVDRNLLIELLKIGIPVMPTILIYWIFNSCDRIMLSSMVGLEILGVYSAASKLGQVSQIVYTAFSGGWQYFAFYTMKDKGQVESNSQIFEYLGVISLTIAMFVFSFSQPIFKVLLTEDYLEGYIAAPYLFLAPLLLMLYQVVGNQFIIIKKTFPSLVILTIGAVLNVFLNYKLIPRFGIEGASIATLSGYIVSILIMCIVTWRKKLFCLNRRFFVVIITFLFFLIIWRCFLYNKSIVSGIISLFIMSYYLFLYYKDIKKMFVN